MAHVAGLDQAEATKLELVGGKGANLAKTMQAGFPVPPGFCVTTEAYDAFIDANQLDARIQGILEGLDTSDNDALEASTAEIRALIESAGVSSEIADAIRRAYNALEGEPYVAVRSSGTAEDLAEASFAGLHETYLDVRGPDEVVDATRRCWASLWTPRATSYRADKGFDSSAIGIAVVVQAMITSEVSGVLFTGNPINTATDELADQRELGPRRGGRAGNRDPRQLRGQAPQPPDPRQGARREGGADHSQSRLGNRRDHRGRPG